MGSFQTFAEMLEKKIRREIERESRAHTGSPTDPPSEISAEAWTRLVGEMDAIHFTASQKAAIYHKHRVVRPRPNHVMNEQQKMAWSFFQARLESPLLENFSRSDLKRAFRSLALRLHPDHGGSSTQIQELLAARQELEKVFQK